MMNHKVFCNQNIFTVCLILNYIILIVCIRNDMCSCAVMSGFMGLVTKEWWGSYVLVIMQIFTD